MATRGPKLDICDEPLWLEGYRKGASWAMARVFQEYLPYVVAIVGRGVRTADGAHFVRGIRDPGEQQDLIHEVFVRVFSPKLRQSYDGKRRFAPFLAQVARHVMLDRARQQSRQLARREALEAWAQALDVDSPWWGRAGASAESLLINDQEQQQAKLFKEGLSPFDLQFVQLRFEQGLPQRECAAAMGITRYRVRELEDEIRQRFKEFYKK